MDTVTVDIDFLRDLEDLWATGAPPVAEVDWAALGVDPWVVPRIDGHTHEALAALEPPRPRPWRRTAHDYQLQVADATEPVIAMIAGRGAGKTHTAANVLGEWAQAEPGDYAIIAPTFGDAVTICVDGPSGFMRANADLVDRFNRNEYVIYLHNGSRIRLASADAPDRVRGWNFTGAWCDETGSWKDSTVWYEGLEFALRIGRARRVITTTPRRGNKILKDLFKRIDERDPDVRVVRASTRDNAANLSAAFLRAVETRYAGTTLGRQELDGELLPDVEGALVTTALIDATRVTAADIPDIHRVVVGVDPAVSHTDGSDHTGIVVLGVGPAPRGWTPPLGKVVLADAPHLYVLQDASVRASVGAWARRVLDVADEWAADRIVAEKNNGHDLVESNIRLIADASERPMPAYSDVWASKGKAARAEPVAGLWEQHRVHIVRDTGSDTTALEEEWTGWVPAETRKSPDRLDAMVWAAVGLMPTLSTKGETLVRLLSAAG